MLITLSLTTVLSISVLFGGAYGYSHGGPSKSCQTLTPGHGVDKQYGVAPYQVTAGSGPSGNIIVTITSTALPFAGFMLQARLVSDTESIVNGRFSEDSESQTRSCNGDNRVCFTLYKLQSYISSAATTTTFVF